MLEFSYMIENLDLKQMAGRGLAIAGLMVISGCGAPQEKVVRADSTQNPYTIVVEGQNYRIKQVSRQGIEIYGTNGWSIERYNSRLQGLKAVNERCRIINWANDNDLYITSVTTDEDFCLLKFQDR